MASQNAVGIVEKRLRQQRHFTLPEAASLTGLSIDDTREALEALLTTYVCRLQVSENGDLIYNFGSSLRRRGSKTFAERLQTLRSWLWNVFTIVYRAWITVTLVVYFVIFLALFIVLLIASSARQSSDRRRTSSFDLGPLLHLFIAIFNWRTVTGAIGYNRDRYGYRYRRYEPEPGILNPQKKSFIAAVYDFVFGPPRAALDPLQNEKEVAAYVRQQKGILVTSELIALAGWTFPQAETFLTDCVIRYQGDTKVSEKAVLVAEFDTIVRSIGEMEEGEVIYYWDEYEPEYELTGNNPSYNLLIGFMNSFNLLIATLVLTGNFSQLWQTQARSSLSATMTSVASGSFFTVFLGWLPLVFSLLFFAIPLGRWITIRAHQQRQHVQNIRKRLFKAIFANQGQAQALSAVLATVNASRDEETLPRQEVQERLQEIALDMEGDVAVDDAAELQFAFPRIQRELQEVAQLRRHRRVDTALGKIIVESDNIEEP